MMIITTFGIPLVLNARRFTFTPYGFVHGSIGGVFLSQWAGWLTGLLSYLAPTGSRLLGGNQQ